MNKTVYIVGIDHKYQHNSELYEHVDAESLLALESLIRKVCKDNHINAVGEEFCPENLMKDTIESYIKVIADKIYIPHRYCNTTSDEDNELGVKQFLYKMKDETEDEFKRRDWENDRLREKGWLKKIIEFNKWPLLFICGSLHVFSLKNLLKENGIYAKILYESWDS